MELGGGIMRVGFFGGCSSAQCWSERWQPAVVGCSPSASPKWRSLGGSPSWGVLILHEFYLFLQGIVFYEVFFFPKMDFWPLKLATLEDASLIICSCWCIIVCLYMYIFVLVHIYLLFFFARILLLLVAGAGLRTRLGPWAWRGLGLS